MRQLITLIVAAALCVGGWQVWQKHPEYFAGLRPKAQRTVKENAPETPAVIAENTARTVVQSAEPTPQVNPEPAASEEPAATGLLKPAEPTPIAEIKRKLPPGQFLMTQRVSAETRDGITAVIPGDTVKLLERRRDGTLKVTNGRTDFIVRADQVTQDLPSIPGQTRTANEANGNHRGAL